MLIEKIREKLFDNAKDIKMNFDKILSGEYSIHLSETQIFTIFIACIYSTRQSALIDLVNDDGTLLHLPIEYIDAAKSAATIMTMNNIYYRFIHLVEDSSYETMPAHLRMQAIARPGIDKNDFELCCLAISAINGCGMCMNAHSMQLVENGVSKQSVQSAIRIAAVVNAIAQAFSIDVSL